MGNTGESRVELQVLGSIRALRDGQVLALGGPRQRALLALLVLQPGRPMSVDRLVDELWAGEPPNGAEVTLRSYVSRLRQVLGNAAPIRGSANSYELGVASAQLDLVEFERLVRTAEAELGDQRPARAAAGARAALQLWRGRPFGDAGDLGLLRVEADRLEALRLQALQVRMEAELALGGGPELVLELEQLVREHPYREAFWRQLMLALYRSERQADALAAYQRARGALDEELGIEPGPELEALQAAVLRHEVPPVAVVDGRHNLPEPLTTFIGREAELAEVATLLDESRLVTLVGVGGVGKTRVALEAARVALPDFADGAWFVDLAPISDPGLAAGHVAATLGLREQAGVATVKRLVDHLRSADVLLVLDNCEHLREACAALVGELLRSTRGLRVLATSREILGVPGERDFAVPPLRLSASEADSTAVESEAVRLFLARAREARPTLPADAATLEVVARICADLDGLPLGIELAAARARALSPAEIASRLRDRFQFLVSWRRLAAARHRTLREAMDWSYALLEPEEQRILRALSVFAGGFTLEAVAAITTDGDVDLALPILERLVEASLVAADTTHEPTRYTVLETVRQYAAEQLETSGERAEVRRRHAEHFAAFAEAAWQPLRTAGIWVQADWIARLGQERENLRSTLAWQQEAEAFDALLRTTESLWWIWWIRGELAEGRAWLQLALERATDSDPHRRALALLGLAGLSWAQGDLVAAEQHATAALALFEATGDRMQEGSTLNTLGLIASGRRDLARAREHFEASLARIRSATDPDPGRLSRNLSVTIDNLGSVSLEFGDFEAANAQYREALELNQARGDAEGVAMAELHIALVEAQTGELASARTLLGRSLAVYRSIGFHQYAAECLEAASMVANGTGAPEEAAFLLGAAARLRDEASVPPVPVLARIREQQAEAARVALGAERFRALTDEARRMPIEAALQRALAYLAGSSM